MDYVKRFKISYAILSGGYILLGVLRLLFPSPESQLLCYMLGGIAIVMGIVRVTIFFSKRDPNRVFHHDLAIGVTLLCVGVYIVARPTDIADILPVVLGFCILFDSVIKLQYAFEMRRTGMKAWYVVLVVAVLAAIAGVLLIIHLFSGSTLVYYLGVVLVADGLANLAALLLMTLRLKQLEKPAAGDAAKGNRKKEKKRDEPKTQTTADAPPIMDPPSMPEAPSAAPGKPPEEP